MPKLPGRKSTRPQIRELTVDYVTDTWRMVLHEWERPAMCAVVDCGIRPDLMDRYAIAALDSEFSQCAEGKLDVREIAWFTLCDFHARFLEALHNERSASNVS